MLNIKNNNLLNRDNKTPTAASNFKDPSSQGTDSNHDNTDLNGISPILMQNKKQFTGGAAGDLFSKSSNQKLGQAIDTDMTNEHNYFIDLQTPNSLVKNFYQNPQSKIRQDQDQFYNRDSADFLDSMNDDENNYQEDNEEEGQDFITARKEVPNQIQMKKSGSGTCAQFDLIAQEIQSSKRSERTKIKAVTNGKLMRQSDPRKDDQKSDGSDIIKWAISKDSQQETQKKTASNNPLELISKTLKSHDSYTSNLQQQYTVSSNNPVQIKGKVLDFGNTDSSKKYVQFGLLQNNSQDKKYFIATEESNLLKGEKEIISFLDDDNEEANILISSLQKRSHQLSNAPNYNFSKKQPLTSIDGVKFQIQKLAEALQEMVENNVDCQFCFEQKMFHSSLDCTKIEGPKSRGQIIEDNLNKKYLTSREYYNVKIINDVIYNENTHIVSVFKDYLIFDDVSEFLKRSYNKQECLQRLPRMYEFYEKYSKVFPNYVIIPENKYMFKNIEKKQRLQDEKQRIIQEQQQKKSNLDHSGELQRNRHKDRFSQRQHQNSSSISLTSNNRMFNTNFIDSVMNFQPSGVIELSITNSKINISIYQEHILNSSILIQKQLKENMDKSKKNKEAKKKGKGGLEDLDMDELISKFIAKDTESNIHESLLLSEAKQPSKQQIAFTNIQNKQEYEYENQNAKKAKAKVYEYQSTQQVPAKGNESSKQTDNSGRPSSGKQQNQYDHRRLSTGSNNVGKAAQLQNNIYYEDQKQNTENTQSVQKGKAKQQQEQQKEKISQELNTMKEEAKVLNYNIYNNFNQFINNENYYISTDKDAPNSDQDQISSQKEAPISQPQSLSRTQSRSNLISGGSINNRVSNLKQQQNIQTPSKLERVSDKKTPTSGSIGRKGQAQKQIRKKCIQKEDEQDKHKDNQQQYALNRVQVQEQNDCISINDNKSTNSVQRISIEPSASPRSILQREQIGKMIASGKITKSVNSNVMSSREMSKEKPQKLPLNVQKPNLNIQNQQVYASTNQMFKKEQIKKQQLNHQIDKQQAVYNPLIQSIEHDYSAKQGQIHSTNVRSVERLKLIEEEIEKDYSKYQNEYGLTKTAFAKAVNQLREKTLQQEQELQTKENIRAQNSNEKTRRAGSNTNRANSNSQTRKQAQNKLRGQSNQNQESANDLYMNTNRQDQSKNIRSIRAKTHLNSQNSSSCFQKSQKFSPDKNTIIPPNQLNTISNAMLFNQSELPSKQYIQPSFVTLKSQPNQGVKGLKIKFPLNQQTTSRGNSSSKNIQQKSNNNNNNSSQTQTPKRLKLQKTRSTSTLMGGMGNKALHTQSNQNIFTQRGRVPELGILEQISQQYNGNPQLSATQKDILNQISSLGINPLQINDFNMQSIDSTTNQNNYAYPPQYPFAASCGGTYATTSMLNSPLSFKQAGVIQRNNSKGRTSSRNGNQSSHQSQKSITNHQRASSTANTGLIGSNNKIKQNKRMSAGSNISKNPQQRHQIPSSGPGYPNPIQNQLIQLLLAYQNNSQLPDTTDLGQTNATGISSITQNMGCSQIPLSQTLKNMQQQVALGQQSMKNLKSIKQPATTSMMKDVQMIKPTMMKQGALIMHQQMPQTNSSVSVSNLQSQRQSTQQPTILGQIIQSKNGSKSSKNTSRGDSRKKISNNVVTYQQQPHSNNEGSQRHLQYIQNNMDSTLGNTTNNIQDSRKLLSYSRSQESLDLIKMMTQKAAQEQYLQQQQQTQQYSQFNNASTLQPSQHQLQNTQSTKQLLQNLKQSSGQGDNQILFQKVKLAQQNPSAHSQESSNYNSNNQYNQSSHQQTMSILQQQQANNNHHHQQQPPTLQSVRNLQFQIQSGNTSNGGQYGNQQQQFQFRGNDYEGVPHSSKNPQTILLPQDKPISRRTSSKFNPQSTKNN